LTFDAPTLQHHPDIPRQSTHRLSLRPACCPPEFEDFRDALAKLPSVQREALLLVGASGFSLGKQSIRQQAGSVVDHQTQREKMVNIIQTPLRQES
jgi:hypothetical protein